MLKIIKFLRPILLMVFFFGFFGMMGGTSFALHHGTPLTFEDTVVYPTNPLKWTHSLQNTDFTPNLDEKDEFKVRDAKLDIQMDFTVGKLVVPGVITIGFIDVIASGDSIYLGSLNINDPIPGALYNDFLWTIDLGDNISALEAMEDKNFMVSLKVNPYYGGSINRIDDSKLSGTAIVTPEPGTLLLLGSGLLGLGLYGRKRILKSRF